MTRLTFSVVLKHGNHLVDYLLGGMAPTLALLDLLWVATALSDEVVDVQHCCAVCLRELLGRCFVFYTSLALRVTEGHPENLAKPLSQLDIFKHKHVQDHRFDNLMRCLH